MLFHLAISFNCVKNKINVYSSLFEDGFKGHKVNFPIIKFRTTELYELVLYSI